MTEQRQWRVREADASDVATLAEHRRRMFVDLGAKDSARIERMAAAFVPYAAEHMPRGELRAWLAEADGAPIAGVAAVIQQVPPSMRNPEGTVGYILNMYVEPEWRRQGVARSLMETAIDALRTRGIGGVVLHASDQGRPLYEKLGFAASSEMRLFFDPAGFDPYGHHAEEPDAEAER